MTTKSRNVRLVLVVASFLGSILLLYCFKTFLDLNEAFEDVSSWGTFFSVYGVLYAILAGFLIVEAISKYNSLQAIMDDELNNIQDIRDLAIYLDCDKSVTKKIISELIDYLNYVAHSDWIGMQGGCKALDADTSREMYEIYAAINEIERSEKGSEISLKILMSKMVEITTLRTKRISLAAQKLPDSLKLLMTIMSSVLVVGFLALGVHNLVLHLMMIVSILASVLILHGIILDIDQPFDGTWNLSPEPYLSLKNKMEIQLQAVG